MAHTELKFNEAICVQGTSLMPALGWAPRSGVEGSSSGGGGEPHPSGEGRELGACELSPSVIVLGQLLQTCLRTKEEQPQKCQGATSKPSPALRRNTFIQTLVISSLEPGFLISHKTGTPDRSWGPSPQRNAQ